MKLGKREKEIEKWSKGWRGISVLLLVNPVCALIFLNINDFCGNMMIIVF